MSETYYVVLAVATGVLLGMFFFGGLWWTVKKGVSYSRPALFFTTSVIIRIGLVLVGFYFVSYGSWERFLGCLAGFIIAKIVATQLIKFPDKKQKESERKS